LEVPKLVSRGVFTATREELVEMNRQDHLAKVHGLAVYVLKMPTKQKRRKFLEGLEQKMGEDICYQVKDKILELHTRDNSTNSA
jgi:hypothetical protein